MKTCFSCKRKKPLSEFYAHEKMADGYLNKCKACTKKDVKKYRMANLEKIRGDDRERAKQPKRKETLRINTKKYRRQYPERNRANYLVYQAKRNGEIIESPCLICGFTGRVEAHHEDYSKPLDIAWLCSVHHSMIHKTWQGE